MTSGLGAPAIRNQQQDLWINHVEANPFSPSVNEASEQVAEGDYPGIRRLRYLLLSFGIGILSYLLTFGLAFAGGRIAAAVAPGSPNGEITGMGIGLLIGGIFTLAISLWVLNQRLQNVGMPRWWMFMAFVPLVNLYVGFLVVCCPPGYADHKTLDGKGQLLLAIYILFCIGLPLLSLLISLASLAAGV